MPKITCNTCLKTNCVCTPVECGCKLDLDALCVTYTGKLLATSGVIKGTRLEDALIKIDDYLNTLNTNIILLDTPTTKIVDIGDWNMDSTNEVDIPHGLSLTELVTVRSMDVIIRKDDESQHDKLNAVTAGGNIGGGVSFINVSNIRLIRVTTGAFDSVDYDSTSFNRGWIYIVYTKDIV